MEPRNEQIHSVPRAFLGEVSINVSHVFLLESRIKQNKHKFGTRLRTNLAPWGQLSLHLLRILWEFHSLRCLLPAGHEMPTSWQEKDENRWTVNRCDTEKQMGIDGVQTTDSMNIFQPVDESMTEWGTPFPDTPKSSNFQTFQSLEGDGLFFSDKCSGYLTQIWLNLRRKPSRIWVDFEWSLEPL